MNKMTSVPFFENDYITHDLRHGTATNRGGTKMCFMPSELIQAFQKVLEEETGPMWRDVMKTIGTVWGRRVARRFTAELRDYYGRSLYEMPMKEMVKILEGYFAYHGWGRLEITFTQGEAGLIIAKLTNSAFSELLGASDGPVDQIVAGLLGEFFCEISERPDLDCFETQCSAEGAPHCQFIVGHASRMAEVPSLIESGMRHNQILSQLLAFSTSGKDGTKA